MTWETITFIFDLFYLEKGCVTFEKFYDYETRLCIFQKGPVFF